MEQTIHYNRTSMKQRPFLAPVFFLLALYAAFMISTNDRLTILDDEAIIASVANNSVQHTLAAFLHGTGQHEHPPLSDIFLHGWLLLTNRSLAWLRIFANIFFIVGLLVLAKCGELLGNRRTAWAVLLLGTLWPFGYFYARLAGWYAFCFLLVSLLLFCYFRLLANATPANWTAFACTSILLVWSNYYGIGILFFLLADMLLLQPALARKHVTALIVVSSSIIVSFLPLLRALMADRASVNPEALTWTASVVKILFMLFATIASIAVAPWFLPWSISCALAMLSLFVLLLARRASRRASVHFLLLIVGLALTNHLDLKRLLFVTPWLLLAMAGCVSTFPIRPAVGAFAAITIAFSIGWLGIVTGRHPAISNFYEPWQAVARDAVARSGPHTAIVSNSGPFFFYLDSTLLHGEVPGPAFPGSPEYRDRQDVSAFVGELPSEKAPDSFSSITIIRGANPAAESNLEFQQTVDQISRACKLVDSQRYSPDPARAYKRLFEPQSPLLDYRVAVDRYDCSRRQF